MNLFNHLLQRAQANPKHIVLPEGADERIIAGSLKAVKNGVARVTLLGDKSNIEALLQKQPEPLASVDVIDPKTSDMLDAFAIEFYELRKHKGISPEDAQKIMTEALYFGAMMVRRNLADGSLAGAVNTTGNTIRAALQTIGLAKSCKTVSSFFIMMIPKTYDDPERALIFADCALVVSPNSEELAEIAIASADSAAEFLKIEPRVAMLSFSTRGSASHPMVDKVTDAANLAKNARPDLVIEGDLQLDAALVPSVNASKAPGSKIGGHANVLIFPSLEAGNIGYKLAERIGQAQAIGPVLQGLAKPANDLSRGCSADDVYGMIAVTVVQAQTAAPCR